MTDPSEPSITHGSDGRPRTVDAAYYCWLTGGSLTAATGLLMLTYPVSAYKAVGVLALVAGLALGFLAGRARKRDPRFARAALALAMATVALLGLIIVFLPVPVGVLGVVVLAFVALIAGSVLNQRAASLAWYDPQGRA